MSNDKLRGSMQAHCTSALIDAQRKNRPDLTLTDKGYVSTPEENLLPSVVLKQFECDLKQGSGNELQSKFMAAHSSSALAVNCFAPFRDRISDLSLSGANGFCKFQFEKKCSTGLKGAPPNLDIVAEAKDRVVAIESKCTEYLSAKRAEFSPNYAAKIQDDRRESAWFGEMQRLTDCPVSYLFLDAAQLVKHALGVALCFKERSAILVYLYWEPENADEFPEFEAHKKEISRFSECVAGEFPRFPRFEALSYTELWSGWETGQCPSWLKDHLQALRARYLVTV